MITPTNTYHKTWESFKNVVPSTSPFKIDDEYELKRVPPITREDIEFIKESKNKYSPKRISMNGLPSFYSNYFPHTPPSDDSPNISSLTSIPEEPGQSSSDHDLNSLYCDEILEPEEQDPPVSPFTEDRLSPRVSPRAGKNMINF
jgi:hypothetical protein